MIPNNQAQLSDENFEDEIFQHLKNMGLSFPESPEELDRFLITIEKNKMPAPTDLPTSTDILRTGFLAMPDKLNDSADATIENYLAQAAREGKGISKEVLEKMNKDRRKSAEGSQDAEE